MGKKTDRARALRPLIEQQAQGMSAEEALRAIELYPEWDWRNVKYTAGKRVRYGGILYEVREGGDHTSQPSWNPEAAVSLFKEVLIPDENVVSEWKQSTDGYKTGDRVSHNGRVWENVLEGVSNVWEPGVVDDTFWKDITDEGAAS